MREPEATFPLIPRSRLIGLSFGRLRSARRGAGTDVAGSRPYVAGDDVDLIDWAASAKLSAAHGSEEFVVRQTFADEAPRVVVLCDRRPAMRLFEPPLPWLSKQATMREAVELICDSAASARGYVGYLDLGDGEPFWRQPRSERDLWEIRERHLESPAFAAPEDNLEQALDHLLQHGRALPPGTFLFVVSDFLAPPSDAAWTQALGQLWDVVPVVVQDPVWERSFPDVAGLVVPFLDPATGRTTPVRLNRAEVRERREQNEARFAALLEDLDGIGLEPIVLSTEEPEPIFAAFASWSEERLLRRGRLVL